MIDYCTTLLDLKPEILLPIQRPSKPLIQLTSRVIRQLTNFRLNHSFSPPQCAPAPLPFCFSKYAKSIPMVTAIRSIFCVSSALGGKVVSKLLAPPHSSLHPPKIFLTSPTWLLFISSVRRRHPAQVRARSTRVGVWPITRSEGCVGGGWGKGSLLTDGELWIRDTRAANAQLTHRASGDKLCISIDVLDV